MEFTPDSMQTLFLWRLLADDGGAFQQGLKPDLPKPRRDPLVKAGLIEVVKRRKDDKGQPVNFLQLTDIGWDWAAANLDAEVSPRSTAAGPILQALMTKLKAHLTSRQIALADFVRPPDTSESSSAQTAEGSATANAPAMPVTAPATATPATASPAVTDTSPADRVRRVCERLVQGQRGVRVYLADLRSELADLDRHTIDEALRTLERDRALVLYPLDNPQEIRPQDAAAALTNSAGRPRHIAYLT